jgi:nitroreductase
VHLFDCGSAFENLALQGTAMQLVIHGMQGFDYEKARIALRVPDDYAVAAMFAVGRPGDPDDLPTPVQEREKPSGRKPAWNSSAKERSPGRARRFGRARLLPSRIVNHE